MLWVKSFHVIFMVTWFAGLFYLPRLFVYHADMPPEDQYGEARFAVMERRLMGITHLGALLTAVFGLWLLLGWRGSLLQAPWFHAKLGLLVLLYGYHFWCAALVRRFAAGRNQHTGRWYRVFNEVPALALIAIVLLAIQKPYWGA